MKRPTQPDTEPLRTTRRGSTTSGSTHNDRAEREHKALALARLALAQDRIACARLTLQDHGFGERLEIEIVRALSELDAAERLNHQAMEALGRDRR